MIQAYEAFSHKEFDEKAFLEFIRARRKSGLQGPGSML